MSIGAVRGPLAVVTELLAGYAAVAVFVAVFGQGDGPAPSFVLVAIAVLGSYAIARLLQSTDLDETSMRIIGVAACAVLFFVSARIAYAPGEYLWDLGWLGGVIRGDDAVVSPNGHVIAGGIALVPLWFRGVVRGQSEILFDDVLASVSFGVLVVVAAALTTPDTRESVSWGAFAFVYALAGMATLGLFAAPDPASDVLAFGRRWSSAFIALAAVSIVLALLAAAIDPDAFGFLSPVGEPLRIAGRLLGAYVLNPILVVLSLPFRGLAWLIDSALPRSEPPVQPSQPPGFQKEDTGDRSRPLWMEIVTWVFVGGIGTLVTVVAALLAWTAFRRYTRSASPVERDRRDSVEPASSFGDDLAAMLGALTSRLRRPGRTRSAVEVRRLYFEMLDAASARGLARPPSATPAEFAPQLDAHFVSDAPAAITAAFAASRYGDRAIDDAVVRDLRARWRALMG